MINVKEIWKNALSSISTEMTAVSYMLWVEKLEPFTVSNGCLILVAPSLNAKITVKEKHLNTIKRIVTSLDSNITSVDVITEDKKEEYSAVETDSEIEEKTDEDSLLIKPSQFLKRLTFDNFVIGESNKVAYYASLAVAKNPGSSESNFMKPNPLFIYGGVGLGKTHLLHAIGNYIEKNSPSVKILYMPTDTLSNDYFEALNKSSTDKNSFLKFRERFKNVDVLMLDDVQSLSKKISLQEVVFNVFNDLYQNGKQIILSSDRPPKEIATLEERLRSRFEGGLLADISHPDLELRIAILQKEVYNNKLAVSDEVIDFIGEKVDSNVRDLLGALTTVVYFAQLKNKSATSVSIASEALKYNENDKKESIETSDIIDATCEYFNVSKDDIFGKKKNKEFVEPRMVAIYLITEMISIPLASIGILFGNRDHTTVMHARNKIAEQIKTDSALKMQIVDIKNAILKQ